MKEDLIKDFMKDKICPKCLKKKKKKDPEFYDCALHYHNDVHLCYKANRLK